MNIPTNGKVITGQFPTNGKLAINKILCVDPVRDTGSKQEKRDRE